MKKKEGRERDALLIRWSGQGPVAGGEARWRRSDRHGRAAGYWRSSGSDEFPKARYGSQRAADSPRRSSAKRFFY